MKKEGFVEALCKIFEKNGVLSQKEAKALRGGYKDRSDLSFEDFILEEGLIEKEDILQALSIYYNVPWMDPVGYFFDHYLIKKFPKDFLLRNLIVPIEVIEDTILMVLANNPDQEDLLPEIGHFVSYDIEFRVGLASEIIDTIEEFYDKSLTDIERDDSFIPETDEELRDDLAKEIEDISEE